jgi:hypothetical protein
MMNDSVDRQRSPPKVPCILHIEVELLPGAIGFPLENENINKSQ